MPMTYILGINCQAPGQENFVRGSYPAQAALLANAANAALGLRATIISNERATGSMAWRPCSQLHSVECAVMPNEAICASGNNLRFYSAFSLYWAGTSGMDAG